jgi:AraC-like DNA-binding protein
MKETIRKHIISWVEDNIYSLANIDDLTTVLGYSRRTIENWFKQEYGLSLGDYIIRRRICRAAVLIRMTSLPITEIAYLFHYHSSQGFARAFKKLTGLSPSDYRTAEIWEFDKLQPSLLLKDVKLPEVELCSLDREFAYNHTLTVQDHIFEPAVSDVTKSMRKMLLESAEVLKELAISARHSALLSKGRESIVEVDISWATSDLSATTENRHVFHGNYARMDFEGDWDTYGAFSKIVYMLIMTKYKLKLRHEIHLMKLHSYSEERVNFSIFIPVM